MKFILYLLFIATLMYAQTGAQLSKPNDNVYDFTFEDTNNANVETFRSESIVEKALVEVSKAMTLTKRTPNLFVCGFDMYNNRYCPSSLTEAAEYWGYEQSQVVARTQTVVDFEQGTYQELTSTVRDFMDGYASVHNTSVTDYQTGSGTTNVGTVIDYQNGSSVKMSNFAVDYTNKTATGSSSIPATVNYEYYIVVRRTVSGTYIPFCQEIQYDSNLNCLRTGNSGLTFYELALEDAQNDPQLQLVLIIKPNYHPSSPEYGYFRKSNYSCPSGYILSGNVCVGSSLSSCPDGYLDNGSNCQKNVSFDFYQYTCPASYSPINSGFTSYAKTDPNISAENWNTLDDDVNSSVPPTGNCQKTITYSYYNYNCPAGYTVRDAGLTSSCPRTDPDNNINNESTLSQACNSSMPPAGNCEKIIPYTFYSYECSSGYIAIDSGLSSCSRTDSSNTIDSSSTLDDPCNSSTPPAENCYKDITYKHYTYGCSPGYVTDNYGLLTCPKTDPNKNVNNSATLDDDCNSSTPPAGNCQRPIEYSLYEYICTGSNDFGEAYEPVNVGLTSCERADIDNISNNGATLDDPCNSSTAPVNNCRAINYTCNSTVIEPAFVDGKWQCSPYLCDEQNKCGFGTCPTGTSPSTTLFQDNAYNPLGADFNGTCTGPICDYVANKQISFCTSGKCPNGSEYETIDGKCYKKECPAGTFDSNGSCIRQN